MENLDKLETNKFCELKISEWQSLANWIRRRNRIPVMMSQDDIVQEMMLEGWIAAQTYKSGYGGTLRSRVIFCAVKRIQQKITRINNKVLKPQMYSVEESLNPEEIVSIKLDHESIVDDKITDTYLNNLVEKIEGGPLDQKPRDKLIRSYKKLAVNMIERKDEMKKKSKTKTKKGSIASEDTNAKHESGIKDALDRIYFDEVDNKVVMKYLKHYSLPTIGNLRAKVEKLTRHFFSIIDNIEVVECEKCRGYSDKNLSECPFCGDDDIEVDDLSNIENKLSTEEEEVIEEEEVEEEEVIEEEEESVEEEEAIEEEAVNNEKDKSDSKQLVLPNTNFDSTLATTERDLDNEVKKFNKAKIAVSKNLYAIGSSLLKIKKEELYEHRKDKRGNPLYRSFKQFVEVELEMSHTHAYKIVKVVEFYDQETIEKYGLHRCHVVLELPPEIRKRELESTKSSAKIQKDLKELSEFDNKDNYSDTHTIDESNLDVGNEAEVVYNKDDLINVDIVPGIRTVVMQVRPKVPMKVGMDTKPARSLSDDPWFITELTNVDPNSDVYLHVRVITNNDGQIEAVIEVCRGKI